MACSAANATLDIFENENVIEKNRVKIEYISKKLQKFNKPFFGMNRGTFGFLMNKFKTKNINLTNENNYKLQNL